MSGTYALHARVGPALLASAPALALGAAALPFLTGPQKLWSLLAPALAAYAANLARRHGNRVQPRLWEGWGGAPATSRLRFSDASNINEVSRRHQVLERLLPDCRLPNEDEEAADPSKADHEYDNAIRRAIDLVRDDTASSLLATENRNYGFARNLHGLRPLGIACAAGVLLISIAGWVWLAIDRDEIAAGLPLAFPALVAIIAFPAWAQVNSDFVRPSADAYADRLIATLDHRDQRPRS